MKNLFLTAAMLLALAACDKPAENKDAPKPDDKNATTTTNGTAAANTAATPTPAATPVTIADGDLSTPADFEESAEKAITAKTYKADLAALEADVAKE